MRYSWLFDWLKKHLGIYAYVFIYLVNFLIFLFYIIINYKEKKEKITSLKKEICNYLSRITGINKKIFCFSEFGAIIASDADNFVDDIIRVNSNKKFHNYEQLQYLKKININKDIFSTLKKMSQHRKAKSKKILKDLNYFLETNSFMQNKYYHNVDFIIRNLISRISNQISLTLPILFRIKVKHNLNYKIINFENDYVKKIDSV